MARVEQRNEICLTPELWVRVFALMEMTSETLDNVVEWTGRHRQTLAQQEQARVHQLKLVCTQFRDIYATHPGLIRQLFLRRSFPARLAPNLLAWLQQNGGSVQIFQSAEQGSLVEAVLAGLVLSEQCMRLANVCNPSACSISLIATFQRLEKCGLWSKSDYCLDLAPLGSLPRLKHLLLHGQYYMLHHLTGLTRLDCNSADVIDVQQISPSLQHLEIDGGSLTGMHRSGLSLCSGLTWDSLSWATVS